MQKSNFLFFGVLLLLSCRSDDLEPSFSYEMIPDQIYAIDKDELSQITQISELTPFFVYNVIVNKIEYKTTYNGQIITVSGAIALPIDASNPAIIAYSHGTLDNSGDAPTQVTNRPLTFTQLAASGYIVFAPDGIGIGSYVARQDPWLIAEPSAQAVVDMISAGKDFLAEYQIPYTDKVFLAGYSQGGNNTLAALRKIEESNLDLKVMASAPGGGVYDMEYTFDRRINGTSMSETLGVVYLLAAFIDYYGWEANFSSFLQEPYAAEFDHIHQLDGFFVDKILTSTILVDKISNREFTQERVLLESFIDDFNSNSDNLFRRALTANSLTDWKPNTPVSLYYGDADSTSYFENSLRAYDSFITNGADPDKIKIAGFEGKDHSMADGPWAAAAIQYFNSFLF